MVNLWLRFPCSNLPVCLSMASGPPGCRSMNSVTSYTCITSEGSLNKKPHSYPIYGNTLHQRTFPWMISQQLFSDWCWHTSSNVYTLDTLPLVSTVIAEESIPFDWSQGSRLQDQSSANSKMMLAWLEPSWCELQFLCRDARRTTPREKWRVGANQSLSDVAFQLLVDLPPPVEAAGCCS